VFDALSLFNESELAKEARQIHFAGQANQHVRRRRRSDRSALSVRLAAKDGTMVAPDELEFVPGPGRKAAQAAGKPSRSSSSRLDR
jgi:hypothetical protein